MHVATETSVRAMMKFNHDLNGTETEEMHSSDNEYVPSEDENEDKDDVHSEGDEDDEDSERDEDDEDDKEDEEDDEHKNATEKTSANRLRYRTQMQDNVFFVSPTHAEYIADNNTYRKKDKDLPRRTVRQRENKAREEYC